MRVSISAMGSVMLMCRSQENDRRSRVLLAPAGADAKQQVSRRSSPTGLDDARDLATHGELAQLVAAEAKLAEIATWTTGERAAVAQARRIRVARQLLQLQTRRVAIL